MTGKQPLPVPIEACLQDGMHHLQDKVPIHGCPVDILQFDRWTWRAIGPADVTTDKTVDILRRHKLFN